MTIGGWIKWLNVCPVIESEGVLLCLAIILDDEGPNVICTFVGTRIGSNGPSIVPNLGLRGAAGLSQLATFGGSWKII